MPSTFDNVLFVDRLRVGALHLRPELRLVGDPGHAHPLSCREAPEAKWRDLRPHHGGGAGAGLLGQEEHVPATLAITGLPASALRTGTTSNGGGDETKRLKIGAIARSRATASPAMTKESSGAAGAVSAKGCACSVPDLCADEPSQRRFFGVEPESEPIVLEVLDQENVGVPAMARAMRASNPAQVSNRRTLRQSRGGGSVARLFCIRAALGWLSKRQQIRVTPGGRSIVKESKLVSWFLQKLVRFGTDFARRVDP